MCTVEVGGVCGMLPLWSTSKAVKAFLNRGSASVPHEKDGGHCKLTCETPFVLANHLPNEETCFIIKPL